MVHHLAKIDFIDADKKVAKQFLNASLSGIDCFFNVVRRRQSGLERGIHSASASAGVWDGYAPYKPEIIIKYLDILRVHYNYVVTPNKKITPAMKLGLAKANGKVTVEDILYYS